MKEIGNIFLVWRKGSGDRRIPIGLIKKNILDGVRFSYLHENVETARSLGFNAFEGFPDTTAKRIYTENVLEIFGQRLMRSERNDLKEFYEFWKIDTRFKDDIFYMLARTQGLMPTDNFEFLADFNPNKGLSFISEISGLSKSQISSDKLNIGDKLTYVLEPENQFDDFAVKLYLNDLQLGYVKLIHSKVFYRSKSKIQVKVHHIEKNGVLSRVFIDINL